MSDERTAELTRAVEALTTKVDALQAEIRRAGPSAVLPQPRAEAEVASYAWLASLEAPVRRRPQVPRLLLEALFLVACATAAAIAGLDAVAIAAVMVGAWVVVALIEWAASRSDARRDAFVPVPAPAPESRDDPAWFVPPVEHTLLDADPVTQITRLPPPRDDLDATIEQRAE